MSKETEAVERAIADAVEKNGWFVALFGPADGDPSFGYTIGLWKTFGHPEIVAFGLDPASLHETLNGVAERVRRGDRMQTLLPDTEVFESRNARFVDVPKTLVLDYFGYGLWFHEYKPFPVLQLCWPDAKGLFPWEEGSDPALKGTQPLLSDRLK